MSSAVLVAGGLGGGIAPACNIALDFNFLGVSLGFGKFKFIWNLDFEVFV